MSIRRLVCAIALTAASAGIANAATGGHWYLSDDGVSKWQFGKWSRMKPADMAVGDFDGDGKDDLFLTYNGRWEITYGAAAGQEFGRWHVLRSSGVHRSALRFGDVDGDGRTDVVAKVGADYHYYAGGRGTGRKLVYGYGSSINDVAFGNFDADAADELFLSHHGRWYSYGIGKGWRLLNTSDYRARDVGLGDFDGDGRSDVLRTTGSRWYVSWGGKSGWSHVNNAGERLWHLHIADFDGDGRDDLYRPNGSAWQVSYGARSRYRQINRSREGRNQLLVGDFRGDGRADVLFPRVVTRTPKGISTNRHVAFTTRNADDMFHNANRALRTRWNGNDNACPIEFVRSGTLRTDNNAHQNISTKSRYDRAVRAPGGIYVATSITWCGGTGANILGCAPHGGNDLLVAAGTAASTNRGGRGGKLLAHELGHNAGLDDLTAGMHLVMRGSLGRNAQDNQELTSSHCNSYTTKWKP